MAKEMSDDILAKNVTNTLLKSLLTASLIKERGVDD